ncbi:hypothetical protein JCM17960_35040 [Magnetospira thiophila]
MGLFCEAALALGLTLGGLCQTATVEGAPPLPDGDEAAWTFNAPPPPPVPQPQKPPAFPPVVLTRVINNAAPPPPPAPIPRPLVVAPRPDPYRIALQTALAHPAMFDGDGLIDGALPGPKTPQLARLTPGMEGGAMPGEPEGYGAERRLSGPPVDNARILAADRYISGVLETGINSQLDSKEGGEAIIQTSRDVFGYHGRNVLIPKGSRLICDYESPKQVGSTRLSLTCKRVLMAGHRAEILELAAPVGDQQGRAGITGEVDNRFWEKYGTAILISAISATVRLASALADKGDATSSVGAVTGEGAQELSEKFGEITASVLEQTVNLVPIVTIAQGTRVQIRPAHDWYIRKPGQGDGT